MKIGTGARSATTSAAHSSRPAAPPTAPAAAATGPARATATESTRATEDRNRAAATAFFEAFGSQNKAAMEQAYRPDATFKDDMFSLSKRSSIMNMWSKAPPFATFRSEILDARGDEVKARWVVDYEMFGNKVHNEIDSVLTFDANGKIRSQREDWDEHKWMSQALPQIPRWAHGVAYFFMRPALSLFSGG